VAGEPEKFDLYFRLFLPDCHILDWLFTSSGSPAYLSGGRLMAGVSIANLFGCNANRRSGEMADFEGRLVGEGVAGSAERQKNSDRAAHQLSNDVFGGSRKQPDRPEIGVQGGTLKTKIAQLFESVAEWTRAGRCSCVHLPVPPKFCEKIFILLQVRLGAGMSNAGAR
jgi:hypothetical protein